LTKKNIYCGGICKIFAYSAIQWAFENSLFFFNIRELKKLSIIKQQKQQSSNEKTFHFPVPLKLSFICRLR